MQKTDEASVFDVRLIRYNLRRGTLTPQQLEEHLASLPDEAEHGEPTNTRFVSGAESRGSDAEV